MTRFVAVFVAVGVGVAVAIAGAGVARAQTWPSGATIAWERFSIKQGSEFKEPDQEARRQFLNLAHCTCAKVATDDSYDLQYELKLTTPAAISNTTGEIWVGTTCDNDTNRPMMCRQLTTKTIADINTLATPPVDVVKINLFDVVNGTKNMATDPCVQEEGTKLVWIGAKANNTYGYWKSQGVGEVAGDTTKVDTKPPEPLASISASGSESSIEIRWKLSDSNQTDYAYMQALCSYTDDKPVFTGDDVPDPRYQTAGQLCGQTGNVMFMPATPAVAGEPVAAVPFGELQEEFLCGEADPAGGSLRIEGLENGMSYKVALLAIDLNGNSIGYLFDSTVSPRPVTDLWEELNRRESAIEGGCLLSTTYGDGNPLTRTLREFRDGTLARSALGRGLTDAYYATIGRLAVESLAARIAVGIALLPLVALALLWHLLGLPLLLALLALPWLWRALARRLARRRRLAMAIAAAAILLAPALAAADDLTPYWEEPATSEQALAGPGEVKWNVGIRVGPYTPDIDLQFDQNANTGKGPYAAMFGSYATDEDGDGVLEEHEQRVWQIMPMLDVDRVVWRGLGEIGVGGSLGYMQKSAYAYEAGTLEDDGAMRLRSSDKNTFRLIPLAATVTYRFTYPDDRWGIPVIPYLRGGLSYYLWWMSGPNGISKVCDADGGSCDKAYGGTPGVQVSAGLAIRAERIDRDAARSMRNSGIKHAGFYGEVFWGRVDGFGSETKLWVGDTTWFAGANFEF